MRRWKVPIGILNCSFSQTAIQAWVPREGFATADRRPQFGDSPAVPDHRPDDARAQSRRGTRFTESLEEQIVARRKRHQGGRSRRRRSAAPVPGNLKEQPRRELAFQRSAESGGSLCHPRCDLEPRLRKHGRGPALLSTTCTAWCAVGGPSGTSRRCRCTFHQFYSAGHELAGRGGSTDRASDPTAEMRLGTWLARDIPTHRYGIADRCQRLHSLLSAKRCPGNGSRSACVEESSMAKRIMVADGPMFKSYQSRG